jgi:osmotically-inducible protein OsmY
MLATNDRTLHEAVLEELELEPAVAAGRIAIAVEDGVVTLGGTVRSFTEKWAAEDAVRRVEGVRGLAGELKVELPGVRVSDDAAIAKSAIELLTLDAVMLPTLQVEVEGGCVTLTGTSDWPYGSDGAVEAIRKIPGVRAVYDAIAIKPRPAKAAAELKAMIETRFQRLAVLDAKRVEVAVDGNTVTLSGHVSTLAEREQAGEAALSIPGVTKVDNRICLRGGAW